MAHFEVDFAKLKKIGGGSIATFCRRYDLPRCSLYGVNGNTHFQDGTKTQMISETLMALGAGKWVENGKEVV